MQNDQPTANPATEENAYRSLERIFVLLVVTRYGFLSIGAGLLLWGAVAVLWLGEVLTLRTTGEIAVVAVLGPAVVWVSSFWGERLAREAKLNHNRLLHMNRVIQHEIAERERIEEELLQSVQKAVEPHHPRDPDGQGEQAGDRLHDGLNRRTLIRVIPKKKKSKEQGDKQQDEEQRP